MLNMKKLGETIHHWRMVRQFHSSMGQNGPMGVSVLLKHKPGTFTVVASPQRGERTWTLSQYHGGNTVQDVYDSREIERFYNTRFEAGYSFR